MILAVQIGMWTATFVVTGFAVFAAGLWFREAIKAFRTILNWKNADYISKSFAPGGLILGLILGPFTLGLAASLVAVTFIVTRSLGGS
jgi:hypothetical protein